MIELPMTQGLSLKRFTLAGFAAASLMAANGAPSLAQENSILALSTLAPATFSAARALPLSDVTTIRPGFVGAGSRSLQVALLPRARTPVWTDGPKFELVQRKRRSKRRARRGGRQPECKSWKYHGADRVNRPYNPEQYNYTVEYKRNPNRPSRAEAARIAEERFPQMVNDKVLRMLALVNRVRSRRGHTTMKLEPRLMVAAKRHNLDIARYALMQHTGTDCSQLADRVWDAGYTWTKIAENLAGGNESAAVTLRQWTGSSRHLMQMTLPGMTEAGIAYDYNPNPPRSGIPIKHFWTLILARPDPWRDQRFKKPEKCRGINC